MDILGTNFVLQELFGKNICNAGSAGRQLGAGRAGRRVISMLRQLGVVGDLRELPFHRFAVEAQTRQAQQHCYRHPHGFDEVMKITTS